jgi:hypothetical protein
MDRQNETRSVVLSGFRAMALGLVAMHAVAADAPVYQPLLPEMGGWVNCMGATATRIFAAGQTGVHYRIFTEPRWRELEDSSTNGGAVFSYGDTVVFDGGGGNARISFDNGTNWKGLTYGLEPNRGWFWLAHVGSQGIFYSAGFSEAPPESFGLYQSLDYGKTWKHHNVPGSVYAVAEIGAELIVSSDSGLYLLQPRDGILEKIPAGNWKPPVWFYLTGSGTGDVLAGQGGTPIYKYVAASKTWRIVLPGNESRRLTHLKMQDSAAYGVFQEGETEFLQRSTDGGSSWEPARSIGIRLTSAMLPKGESVYFANKNGLEAYHWPTKTWSVDSAGRRAGQHHVFCVLGHSVLAMAALGNDYTRSDDQGMHWKRFHSFRYMQPYLFRSREGVFYQQESSLIRLGLGTSAPDTLPAFGIMGGVMQVEDAGSRYYARVIKNSGGGGQLMETDLAFALEKGGRRWSTVALPFGMAEELAAEDDKIMVRRKDSLSYSADAGANWVRLDNKQIGSPLSIIRQSGLWIAGTGSGLFRSESPTAGWTPILYSTAKSEVPSPVEVIAHSANCLLIRSNKSTLHLSTDRGGTWQRLNAPVSGSYLRRADVSDTLLCLSGQGDAGGSAKGYCLELDQLSTGVKPAWTRMARPGNEAAFDGHQIRFQVRSTGAIRVDGRPAQ